MSTSDFAVIIPSRYASSRFPGKPLIDLHGQTMIERVWRIAVGAVSEAHVYVATDDTRISAECDRIGAQAIMTSPECLTGTDRLAEAAQSLDYAFYVNVQGDEPLIHAEDILAVADAFRESGESVVNAMVRLDTEEEWRSPNVPKVVATPSGRLQYMSRSPIPATKQGAFVKAWKQVCIYAFSGEHLAAFAARSSKTPLEEIEDIEILRFLEMDVPVQMVEFATSSLAVDVPEDVGKVLNALER